MVEAEEARKRQRMRITEARLCVPLRTARESCYQDTTKVVVLCGTCIHEEHGRVRSWNIHTRTHTESRIHRAHTFEELFARP